MDDEGNTARYNNRTTYKADILHRLHCTYLLSVWDTGMGPVKDEEKKMCINLTSMDMIIRIIQANQELRDSDGTTRGRLRATRTVIGWKVNVER